MAFNPTHCASLQTLAFSSCSIGMLGYLTCAMPFYEMFTNRLELFNEVSVALIGYCFVCLVGWDHIIGYSHDGKEVIGIIIACLVGWLAFVNVLLNLLILSKRGILKLRLCLA